MIFTNEQAKQIAAGKKTQARRRLGPNRPSWRSGRDYAVEARMPDGTQKTKQARIVIEGVQCAMVGDIDYHGAKAEGHHTTEAFKAWWVRQHDRDRGWFEVFEATDPELAEVFDFRHADTPVWVITFSLFAGEKPRFLAPAGRPAHRHIPKRGAYGDEEEGARRRGEIRDEDIGYTGNAFMGMPNEPEPIDLRDLNPEWAKAAEARKAEAEGELHERLQAADEKAKLHGVDATRERKAIEDRIAKLERKVRRDAA